MEQWRDIPGYEGLYQASSCGNIRSAPGKITSNARCTKRNWTTRIIKPVAFGKRKRKDLRVHLWKDGKESTWLVSRLVGLAWCNGYRPGKTINHINGNSLDNCAENLEWVTLAENIKKGFESGLYSSIQTSVHLISQDAEYNFESLASASRFLGRNSSYVSNNLKRKRPITDVSGKLYAVKT